MKYMENEDREEKRVSLAEKIGGIIFGIWFVFSIIAGFIASEIGIDAILFVVGQFFLGIVIVMAIKTFISDIRKRHRVSVMGIVFISVFASDAAVLILAACAVRDGSISEKVAALPEKIFGRENCNVGIFYGDVFAVIFFVVSAIALVSVICRRKSLERRCSFMVKAVCSDMRADMRQNVRVGRGYPEDGVFEFTYKDRMYKVCEQTHVAGLGVSRGDVVYLQINPYDPYEFYLENTGIFSRQATLSVAFLMAVSGVMAAVLFVMI